MFDITDSASTCHLTALLCSSFEIPFLLLQFLAVAIWSMLWFLEAMLGIHCWKKLMFGPVKLSLEIVDLCFCPDVCVDISVPITVLLHYWFVFTLSLICLQFAGGFACDAVQYHVPEWLHSMAEIGIWMLSAKCPNSFQRWVCAISAVPTCACLTLFARNFPDILLA